MTLAVRLNEGDRLDEKSGRGEKAAARDEDGRWEGRMKLHVLRYFIAVAQERSITRASEVLHVTQPTLSRQLRELEHEVGCELFRRDAHGITLTDGGWFLLHRAQEIVDLADRTEQELAGGRGELAGTIALGCTECQGFHALADYMSAFLAQHPRVRFDLHTGYTDTMEEQMQSGVIDLALLIANVDTSAYGYVTLPQADRWGVLVRRDSPLAEKPGVALDEIAGEPLILPRRAQAMGNIMNWFGHRSAELRVVATYSLLSNAVLLVEHGLGMAVCMDGAIGVRGSEQCRFVPLTPAHTQRSILAWRRGRVLGPAAAAFVEMVRA